VRSPWCGSGASASTLSTCRSLRHLDLCVSISACFVCSFVQRTQEQDLDLFCLFFLVRPQLLFNVGILPRTRVVLLRTSETHEAHSFGGMNMVVELDAVRLRASGVGSRGGRGVVRGEESSCRSRVVNLTQREGDDGVIANCDKRSRRGLCLRAMILRRAK
jgi:hypothetical protein